MTDNKYKKLLSALSSLIAQTPQTWLDLGCGTGTFSDALATYLPSGSSILGIDKTQQQLPSNIGQVSLSFLKADFVQSDLKLPKLDGIMMANALHFVKDKKAFIQRMESYFASRKSWLIVEYDHSVPNPWVPFPINYTGLSALYASLGYTQIEMIGELGSAYGGNMYACLINKG